MTCNMESPQTNIQFVPSNFNVHVFRDEILERKLSFQCINMKESLMFYINETDHIHFNDLSLAMLNRYDNSPIGTRLLGNFTEEYSKNMASKISKRTNKAVFMSCNVDLDRRLIPLVEKRIFEEMKNYPDKF